MATSERSFIDRCREYLNTRWQAVATLIESGEFADPLLPQRAELQQRVIACLTSRIKSYHYVGRLESKCGQMEYKMNPGIFQ